MIKTVILDFDDTLCLTEEACFYLENQIAQSMGFPPMTRDAHQRNWGAPLVKAIAERIPGVDVDEFMKRRDIFLAQAVDRGIFDKIPQENLEVLDKLKNAGMRLGIITSRDSIEAKHLLHETHPISSRIEAFYHVDNSDYHKPDPRVFDKILAQFDVTPKECVYVGDSLSDATASTGAGIKFIAVMESGLRNEEDFKDQKVDFFAPKFVDILDYILKNK